ncbi:transcription factor bHLH35-like [Tasmannia lanceolata]|uniref:transcription factor bHLH35-like n=1 Tax=Tasmannia lanceolata TaxID=3420 RepID=UPI0040636C7D
MEGFEWLLKEKEDEFFQGSVGMEEGSLCCGQLPELNSFDSDLFHLWMDGGSILQEGREEGGKQEEEEKGNGNENGAKHVMTERNRRNRLNHQLFTLRSLVPNITKMDKQSILVDAHAYLETILQQTEKEMEKISASSDTSNKDSSIATGYSVPPMQPQNNGQCGSSPAISEINAEMLGEERSVLKITCNRATGAVGRVQLVIESLGLEITCTSINEVNRDHMLITTFLRAKKKGVLNMEKLKYIVEVIAAKLCCGR